ncbi:hypothetical protein F5876DRAFT_78306 [Lentinula aff. lateritia]|uniref:Uncharacterized protein n=1 Tax=Lentinula aff. lateritia TaxID=2804960 RepID=A0ACC1TVX1_9AGAR|nr:hypothetical protein F5876DRAFT_78306 [Lentinula aff. lateritia]
MVSVTSTSPRYVLGTSLDLLGAPLRVTSLDPVTTRSFLSSVMVPIAPFELQPALGTLQHKPIIPKPTLRPTPTQQCNGGVVNNFTTVPPQLPPLVTNRPLARLTSIHDLNRAWMLIIGVVSRKRNQSIGSAYEISDCEGGIEEFISSAQSSTIDGFYDLCLHMICRLGVESMDQFAAACAEAGEGFKGKMFEEIFKEFLTEVGSPCPQLLDAQKHQFNSEVKLSGIQSPTFWL